MARAYLDTHELISVDPKAEQLWADIYIRIAERPNRHFRYCPFIGGIESLNRDIELQEAFLRKNPDWSIDRHVRLSEIRRQLKQDDVPYIISLNKKNSAADEIYIADDFVNRANIEKVLTIYLAHYKHDIKSFKWKRRNGFFVIPT